MTRGHFLITSALAGVASATLAPKVFNYLPLGQIKPTGWLYDQLMVQTNGLAGNEMNFYKWVANTDWLGGDEFYSNLEEAGSYWFNGIVPNSVLVNSAELLNQTSYFLNFVLDHQDSTGWIGPEVFDNSKPRYLWGRYPFFFGAIQMTEYNSSLTSRVVSALQKFTSLANTMLKNGEGVEAWTATRWEDYVMTLEWLYDNYPEGNQNLLLETMQLLQEKGTNWYSVFTPGNFPTQAVTDMSINWHGVNMAEGLKSFPATYRFTNNTSYISMGKTAWQEMFEYHGRPSGIFAADEHLAGLQAIRGTELCVVVETMFTGSYSYQVFGDPMYPDRVERIAYNALPAELTGNMWSRQYLQEQNQIAAQTMNPNPFPSDGDYSNVFGLEPNYPCCTVNHPQGWPKFVTNAWLTTIDGESLVQLYHGPMQTTTTLSNGANTVSASVDTLYPFSDTITTTIQAQKAYTHYVRVPSWVVGGTISVNGGSAQSLSANANGLHAVSIPAGKTTFVLNLPSEITIENRQNNSIAIHRGPLHYAFDISRSTTVLTVASNNNNAKDLQFEATDAWQWAIDPNTLKFQSKSVSSLPSPVYDSGLPPYTITVTACPINWPTVGSLYATDPPVNPACTGSARTITLWPYGATKLRISEFPTFDSTKA